jgi:hypothetical protein
MVVVVHGVREIVPIAIKDVLQQWKANAMDIIIGIGILTIVFTPWMIQKHYEYKHPDKFHYDPKHDSPELLYHLAKNNKL